MPLPPIQPSSGSRSRRSSDRDWSSGTGSGREKAESAARSVIVICAALTVMPCPLSTPKARDRFSGVIPSSNCSSGTVSNGLSLAPYGRSAAAYCGSSAPPSKPTPTREAPGRPSRRPVMATAIQKITLSPSRDIPFNKLTLSQSNVRRVKAGISIEELAEDIARRAMKIASVSAVEPSYMDALATSMPVRRAAVRPRPSTAHWPPRSDSRRQASMPQPQERAAGFGHGRRAAPRL